MVSKPDKFFNPLALLISMIFLIAGIATASANAPAKPATLGNKCVDDKTLVSSISTSPSFCKTWSYYKDNRSSCTEWKACWGENDADGCDANPEAKKCKCKANPQAAICKADTTGIKQCNTKQVAAIWMKEKGKQFHEVAKSVNNVINDLACSIFKEKDRDPTVVNGLADSPYKRDFNCVKGYPGEVKADLHKTDYTWRSNANKKAWEANKTEHFDSWKSQVDALVAMENARDDVIAKIQEIARATEPGCQACEVLQDWYVWRAAVFVINYTQLFDKPSDSNDKKQRVGYSIFTSQAEADKTSDRGNERAVADFAGRFATAPFAAPYDVNNLTKEWFASAGGKTATSMLKQQICEAAKGMKLKNRKINDETVSENAAKLQGTLKFTINSFLSEDVSGQRKPKKDYYDPAKGVYVEYEVKRSTFDHLQKDGNDKLIETDFQCLAKQWDVELNVAVDDAKTQRLGDMERWSPVGSYGPNLPMTQAIVKVVANLCNIK